MRPLLDWLASAFYLLIATLGIFLVLWVGRWLQLRGDANRRAQLLAELDIQETSQASRRTIAGFFHPYWSVE